MSKKLVAMTVIVCMVVSLTVCAGSSVPAAAESNARTSATEETETEAAAVQEEDAENEKWDQLAALGKVQTKNGLLFVTITMPAELEGEDVTQESLDEKAGDNFLSAVLNEDGSVTYKMTKKQYKEMLKELVEGLDESLQGLIDESSCSFTDIKRNDDFTEFEVTISGEELNLVDAFSMMTFYMTGGVYGVFTGKTPEAVIVNFYNAKGELVDTADSSKME